MEREKNLKSFAAQGRLTAVDSDKIHHFKIEVFGYKPDRFRINAKDFFGRMVFSLSLIKKDFQILDYKKSVLYVGEIGSSKLKEFLPFDLQVKEIIAFFSGSLPRRLTGRIQSRGEDSAGVRLIIFKDQDNPEIVFVVNRESAQLEKVEMRTRDGVKVEMNFSDFTEIRRLLFPFSVNLRSLESNTELDVVYTEFIPNIELNEAVFNLKIPDKAKVVTLTD